MAESVVIRELVLGEGSPKICVPITGKDQESIVSVAEKSCQAGADLIEWRVDYYEGVEDSAALQETATKIRKVIGEMPLLLTYRTEDKDEPANVEKYVKIKKSACQIREVDLIDVELFMGDAVCKELCAFAKEKQTKVIISNHDFEGTPGVDELVARLGKMHDLGADIAKIAVMPKDAGDVLKILSATNEYVNVCGKGPVITMAMKTLGRISRMSGEIFGSAVTFGTVDKSSAPGQIDIVNLRNVMSLLHEN